MNGIVILTSVFVVYALIATKLERLSITAPMVFGGVTGAARAERHRINSTSR